MAIRDYAAAKGGMLIFLRRFFRENIGSVIVINLLLAAVAFAKDLLFAIYFGTTATADAFGLSFFIVDTLANGLIGSALAVACVPQFSKLLAVGEHGRLNRSFRKVAVAVGLGSVVVALLLGAAGRLITAWSGPGLSTGSSATAWKLLWLLLPIVVIMPVNAVLTSILQVWGKFNVPALGPVLFNFILLVVVGAAYGFGLPQAEGVYVFSVAIVLASMAMLACTGVGWLRYQAAAGKTRNARKPDASASRPIAERGDLGEIFRAFSLYLFILASTQSVLFFERYLASELGTGTIAGLTYAYRISQFPIWVFVAAVAAVALPSLSKWVAMNAWDRLLKQLRVTLLYILGITVPTAFVFYFFREPLIEMLFLRGSFDQSSLAVTSSLLAGYALTIVGQGVSAILLRYYLALGKMGAPLLIYCIAAAVNIGLDVIFVRQFGAIGLGYGAACGWGITAALLLIHLLMTLRSLDTKRGAPSHEKMLNHHTRL